MFLKQKARLKKSRKVLSRFEMDLRVAGAQHLARYE